MYITTQITHTHMNTRKKATKVGLCGAAAPTIDAYFTQLEPPPAITLQQR